MLQASQRGEEGDPDEGMTLGELAGRGYSAEGEREQERKREEELGPSGGKGTQSCEEGPQRHRTVRDEPSELLEESLSLRA